MKLLPSTSRGAVCILVLLAVLLGGCTLATIRPLDPVTGKPIIGNEDQQFNAANYVSDIWDDQLLPALHEQAHDIMEVLDALRTNEADASETYGRHEGRQPYSFMVTGTGTITEVNLESRAGLAPVDADGDGTAEYALAIGPVIRGTALRDSMPFILFNQFTNQMEFASVSNEMHAHISSQLLTPLGDLTTLNGQNITFYGAFTLAELDEIIITPAELMLNG